MYKKAISKILIICLLITCLATTGFAVEERMAGATASFNIELPANSIPGNVSTVTKLLNYTYFTLRVDNVGDDVNFTNVCAWTKNATTGTILSNQNNTIRHGMGLYMNYTTTPSIGTRVGLCMDNPVTVSYPITVKGQWSPN